MILTSDPQAPAHLEDTKAKILSSMIYKTISFDEKWEVMQEMSILAMRLAESIKRPNNSKGDITGTMREEHAAVRLLCIRLKLVIHILNTHPLYHTRTQPASKIRFIKGSF